MHPGFSNSAQHEPGGRLGYLDIPMKFHAGYAFRTGEAKINGNAPFLHWHFGIGDRRVCLDAEIAAAVGAPVRHFLVACFACAGRSAMRAESAIRPGNAFKPFDRCLLIRVHGKQISQRDSDSVEFTWRLLHHLTTFRVSQSG